MTPVRSFVPASSRPRPSTRLVTSVVGVVGVVARAADVVGVVGIVARLAALLTTRCRPLVTCTITPTQRARTTSAFVLTALLALPVILAPGSAHAQGVATNKPVRTLIGDIALILRTDRPGTLRIGVAGETRSLSLSVRATDARRWADSASRLLAPAQRQRQRTRAARSAAPADTSVRRRAVLEEPGVGAGTFVLLRIDSAATRRFMLFVDDASLEGIRQPLEPDDAKLLIQIVKRAATPPRATAPAKKKSAAKGGSAKRSGAKAPAAKAPSAKAPSAKAPAAATISATAATSPLASARQPSTEVSSSWSAASSAGTPVQGR